VNKVVLYRTKFIYLESCVVQNGIHLCTKPGDGFNFDIYGPLLAGHFGFQYIHIYMYKFIYLFIFMFIYLFILFDAFSKLLKLCTFKSTTTKTYLNKILKEYAVNMKQIKCILSESGT
jgi:hypothetical protein